MTIYYIELKNPLMIYKFSLVNNQESSGREYKSLSV